MPQTNAVLCFSDSERAAVENLAGGPRPSTDDPVAIQAWLTVAVLTALYAGKRIVLH